MEIRTTSGKILDSGLVMFPGGHARCKEINLNEVLQHKFKILGKIALEKPEYMRFKVQIDNLSEMSNEELQDIYDCNIKFSDESIDELPASKSNGSGSGSGSSQ